MPARSTVPHRKDVGGAIEERKREGSRCRYYFLERERPWRAHKREPMPCLLSPRRSHRACPIILSQQLPVTTLAARITVDIALERELPVGWAFLHASTWGECNALQRCSGKSANDHQDSSGRAVGRLGLHRSPGSG